MKKIITAIAITAVVTMALTAAVMIKTAAPEQSGIINWFGYGFMYE